MRVVFYGTPEFAVPSLHAIIKAGHDIVAVVTQPDRPHGRSRSTVVPPPVKVAALEHGLPVLQPEKPVGGDFEQALAALNADLGIVVAYGHILRPHVLALPRLGMVNVHASLLPRWRGAAPIAWAIASGDAATGVSIMRMTAGLDSGPVWATRRLAIDETETAGSLTVRLARLGANLLVDTLPAIAGGAPPLPQDESLVTVAPKVGRQVARIDWTRTGEELARHIRAFDPVPGAWTTMAGAEVKLFGSTYRAAEVLESAPGTVLTAGDDLVIATVGGLLRVREVHPSGKRRQEAAEWSRGRGVAAGARFE